MLLQYDMLARFGARRQMVWPILGVGGPCVLHDGLILPTDSKSEAEYRARIAEGSESVIGTQKNK